MFELTRQRLSKCKIEIKLLLFSKHGRLSTSTARYRYIMVVALVSFSARVICSRAKTSRLPPL